MGSARINAVRQRLGLRTDTFRKTVSGQTVKYKGKVPRMKPIKNETNQE